jgi:ATP-dependent Clp protease protease subunit
MPRYNRDDIDKFHDYGIFIPQRIIYMGSEGSDNSENENGVDYLMAERAIKNLHILDTQSDQPITVIMNNPGGDTYHGMAIYDAIKGCRSHVTVKVFGHAMSMGSIILQAADERLIAPNAKFMMHYGYLALDGHAKNAEKWIEDSKRDDKWMEKMYLEKIQEKQPHFTIARLKRMLEFDTILTAEQTVALGLADQVLKGASDV